MADRPLVPPLLIALPSAALLPVGGALIVLGQNPCAAPTTVWWGGLMISMAGLTAAFAASTMIRRRRWLWGSAVIGPVAVIAMVTGLLIWPWMRARCDAWVMVKAEEIHLHLAAGGSIDSAVSDDATCGPCYWIGEPGSPRAIADGWREVGRWVVSTEPLPETGAESIAIVVLQPTRVAGELRPSPTLVVMGDGTVQWIPLAAESEALSEMSSQRERLGLAPLPSSLTPRR